MSKDFFCARMTFYLFGPSLVMIIFEPIDSLGVIRLICCICQLICYFYGIVPMEEELDENLPHQIVNLDRYNAG